MRSVIYKIIENNILDPIVQKEALLEISRLEEQDLIDMDTQNLNLAFEWEDSKLEEDFWAEISDELDYADLEYREDENIEFSGVEY